MSESVRLRQEPQSPGDGAGQGNAARLRYVEALSRRMADQPEAVRVVLRARLQAALGEGAPVPEPSAPPITPRTSAARQQPAISPLAQLNEALRAAREQAAREDDGEPDELASARRFRRTWTRLRIQDEVDEAVARKPANAGPLNSHVLVLQSLDLMRGLSPAYLQRFLAHVETLQWLEEAGQKAAEPAPKAGKTARRKK